MPDVLHGLDPDASAERLARLEVLAGALPRTGRNGLRDALASAREALLDGTLDAPGVASAYSGCNAIRHERTLRRLCDAVEADFRRALRRGGWMDFAELLVAARDVLRDDVGFRASVQARIGAVLVDEVQDTNGLQLELVVLLAEARQGGPRALAPERAAVFALPLEPRILLAVGDRKQSIYDFRGADVSTFEALAKKVVAEGGARHFLRDNRRSQPALLRVLNVAAQVALPAVAAPRDYEVVFRPEEDGLLPVRPQLGPEVCVDALPVVAAARGTGREAEADVLARWLRFLLSEEAPETAVEGGVLRARGGDVAILLRGFSGLEAYRNALRAHGVPHTVLREQNPYTAPSVLDAAALLALLADRSDSLSLAAVLRSPFVGLSDAALFRLAEGGRLDARALEEALPLASRRRRGRGCCASARSSTASRRWCRRSPWRPSSKRCGRRRGTVPRRRPVRKARTRWRRWSACSCWPASGTRVDGGTWGHLPAACASSPSRRWWAGRAAWSRRGPGMPFSCSASTGPRACSGPWCAWRTSPRPGCALRMSGCSWTGASGSRSSRRGPSTPSRAGRRAGFCCRRSSSAGTARRPGACSTWPSPGRRTGWCFPAAGRPWTPGAPGSSQRSRRRTSRPSSSGSRWRTFPRAARRSQPRRMPGHRGGAGTAGAHPRAASPTLCGGALEAAALEEFRRCPRRHWLLDEVGLLPGPADAGEAALSAELPLRHRAARGQLLASLASALSAPAWAAGVPEAALVPHLAVLGLSLGEARALRLVALLRALAATRALKAALASGPPRLPRSWSSPLGRRSWWPGPRWCGRTRTPCTCSSWCRGRRPRSGWRPLR